MKKLIEGLARFKNEVYPEHRSLYQGLASTQSPEVLLIACADSRVVPTTVLQAQPGELFVCRVVGNIVPSWNEHPSGVSATVEYAVDVLKVKHIVVCGHTDCGAMKAALRPESVKTMPAVTNWLKHTERALAIVRELNGKDDHSTLARLTEENALSQLDHLVTYPSVAAKTRAGALRLHAWVFDIPHAEFNAYDPQEKRFVPLDSVADTLIEMETK